MAECSPKCKQLHSRKLVSFSLFLVYKKHKFEALKNRRWMRKLPEAVGEKTKFDLVLNCKA